MKIQLPTNQESKTVFYGFRKAFIKNSSIPLEARFLLILLMTYKGKNNSCWPSIGEISKRYGKNRDTVRKYLIVLEKEGHLKIVSRGIGRSNLYTPSYWKISAGHPTDNKPTEESLPQPNEITLNRSISSENKDKNNINMRQLFEQKRKELGLA